MTLVLCKAYRSKIEEDGPSKTESIRTDSLGLTVSEDQPIAFRILTRLLRVHLKKAGVTDLEIGSMTDT